jgi:hypothetical protein
MLGLEYFIGSFHAVQRVWRAARHGPIHWVVLARAAHHLGPCRTRKAGFMPGYRPTDCTPLNSWDHKTRVSFQSRWPVTRVTYNLHHVVLSMARTRSGYTNCGHDGKKNRSTVGQWRLCCAIDLWDNSVPVCRQIKSYRLMHFLTPSPWDFIWAVSCLQGFSR